jgi:hypothetical protein
MKITILLNTSRSLQRPLWSQPGASRHGHNNDQRTTNKQKASNQSSNHWPGRSIVCSIDQVNTGRSLNRSTFHQSVESINHQSNRSKARERKQQSWSELNRPRPVGGWFSLLWIGPDQSFPCHFAKHLNHLVCFFLPRQNWIPISSHTSLLFFWLFLVALGFARAHARVQLPLPQPQLGRRDLQLLVLVHVRDVLLQAKHARGRQADRLVSVY